MRLRELKHWPNLGEYLAGQEKQYIDLVLARVPRRQGPGRQVLSVEVTKFT